MDPVYHDGHNRGNGPAGLNQDASDGAASDAVPRAPSASKNPDGVKFTTPHFSTSVQSLNHLSESWSFMHSWMFCFCVYMKAVDLKKETI